MLRGEATLDKDVDLLVDYEKGQPIWREWHKIYDALAEAFGRRAKLVPRKFLSPHFAPPVLHILAEAEFLARRSAGRAQERFPAAEVVCRAFVRSIEVIGNAIKRLSDDCRSAHSETPWRKMARTRDRLIHGYDVINCAVAWRIVTAEVPLLNAQLREILRQIRD